MSVEDYLRELGIDPKSGVSREEMVEMVQEAIAFGEKLAIFAMRTNDETERLYPDTCLAMRHVLRGLTALVQADDVDPGHRGLN